MLNQMRQNHFTVKQCTLLITHTEYYLTQRRDMRCCSLKMLEKDPLLLQAVYKLVDKLSGTSHHNFQELVLPKGDWILQILALPHDNEHQQISTANL